MIGDWNADASKTNSWFHRYVTKFCQENGYIWSSGLHQTCQLPRVTRESHGFLHFLQSHGRGNSCSRVYSCPTVLSLHRLLPIIIAGNTFWQHKFTVNINRDMFFCDRQVPMDEAPCRVSMDVSLSASSAVFFPNL